MQAINSNAMNFFVSFRITIIHLLAFGERFFATILASFLP